MIKFRIDYDDNPNSVVDKMSEKLRLFGIIVKQLEGGDGFIDYQIIRDPGLSDESHSLDLLLNHMLEDDPELFGEL